MHKSYIDFSTYVTHKEYLKVGWMRRQVFPAHEAITETLEAMIIHFQKHLESKNREDKRTR
jgi:hypothetical protein